MWFVRQTWTQKQFECMQIPRESIFDVWKKDNYAVFGHLLLFLSLATGLYLVWMTYTMCRTLSFLLLTICESIFAGGIKTALEFGVDVTKCFAVFSLTTNVVFVEWLLKLIICAILTVVTSTFVIFWFKLWVPLWLKNTSSGFTDKSRLISSSRIITFSPSNILNTRIARTFNYPTDLLEWSTRDEKTNRSEPISSK